LTLRIVWPPTRITLAELIYQAFEFQQICPAEKRTILAYDDFRVGSNEIRPLRQNRTDRDIINPEKETSSVTVVALARASELFAAERMERMRDPHKTVAVIGTSALGIEVQTAGGWDVRGSAWRRRGRTPA
jgi:hypothetical protein